MKFPKPKRIPKKYINLLNRQESRQDIIDKIDAIISRRVRDRDHWTCFYCGKQHEVGSRNLSNSHFWGRGKLSVRFDMENCDAACWIPCHKYKLEGHKNGQYRDFKLRQLGKDRYDALEVRANAPYKISTADLKIMLIAMEKGKL